MPVVFLPGRSEFFLWGEQHVISVLTAGVRLGSTTEIDLVTAAKRAPVTGTSLPLLETVAALTAIPAADLRSLPASVALWSLASKLALDLVS